MEVQPPVISWERFQEVAAKANINGNKRLDLLKYLDEDRTAAAQLLHDLGTIISFDNSSLRVLQCSTKLICRIWWCWILNGLLIA